MRLKFVFASAATVLFFLIESCTYREAEIQPSAAGCYPAEISKILVTKCATAGCHNPTSKAGAAGLDLSNWDALFDGSAGGSPIIPGRSDQSFLLNFINVDSTLGPIQEPTMPYDPANPLEGKPLSREEYLTVKAWIDNGAPDCNGKKFSDDDGRDKFYVVNQSCDLLYVFDAERRRVMKAIDVGGNSIFIENPHMIRFAPDGQHYYISFVATGVAKYFQKYRASDDAFVGQVDISIGSWNTFAFSPDSKTAYVIDFSNPGRIAIVDCENMALLDTFTPPGLTAPHGSAVSPNGVFLYVTKQLENGLLKVKLDESPPDLFDINFPTAGVAKPHEIAFSPTGNFYYVTCQGTNDVKVYSSTDIYITSIPVAADPVEMAFSTTTNYLFVTCMQGNSVCVIDYSNNTLIKTIEVGYEPHGLAIDEGRNLVYVANRNTATSGGPPPHHTSLCGGRNGYLVAIDITTLELLPGFKHELSVDPYSVAKK